MGVKWFVAIAAGFWVAGCAGGVGGPPIAYETGRRAAATADGLHRLKSRRVAAAYVRPGASFVGYRKILIEPVEFFYESEKRSESSGRRVVLSEAAEDRLRQLFQEGLEEELGASPSFEIVEEPAPDALRVRVHVVDLVVKVLSVEGKRKIHSFGDSEMTALLDVSDSESGVPIARLVDRRRLGSTETMSMAELMPDSGGWGRQLMPTLVSLRSGKKTAAIQSAEAQWMNSRRLFRRWARVLREGLEELTVLGPIPVLVPAQ
ncbi:MAG: DUF3313 family protein [Myxococcota bacterium]|jgi:hypothetical protein|nr:hypothetical protein [Deltaproteobacteria bacterium]MDP6075623.1 DUF3313 family protein [Myxococcota bacterium]MDP7075367.1 DUF3313 family protein [Myxococcota bacterium]MDP7299104.1 DUF3313 family protein [Myxococcota bacterium]MDP7433446.1 DUF3313 family protein [Myxococcota bacterium]